MIGPAHLKFSIIAAVALFVRPASTQEVARDLRVYFDCNAFCDGNFIRTETPWVAFVRDRADADVHLLITSAGTGAGGQQYTLNFIGAGAFAGRSDTLRYVHRPIETDDKRRRGLTRTIHLGLAPFVARTQAALQLRMELESESEVAGVAATRASDPWKSWVFELDARGSIRKRERQSELEWGGAFDARRITARWKFGASANVEFDESKFVLDEDSLENEIVTLRESYRGGAVLVRSHGAHWGSGMQASLSSSTFSNTTFAFRVAPAVEYSLFPYDEFTRRQLTFQYSVGLSTFRYRELTIFGKLEETRPTHALVIGYDVNQPWGSAEATLETSRYLDNSSQWRGNFGGRVEVRIARGFSLGVGGRGSLIRDQLSIAAREATPEEILLELRDLRTDYRYDAWVGISYTFGSIFSSVVNPRFGTGPGRLLR